MGSYFQLLEPQYSIGEIYFERNGTASFAYLFLAITTLRQSYMNGHHKSVECNTAHHYNHGFRLFQSTLVWQTESPRVCRRLTFLRELAYEQETYLLPRNA